MEKLCLIVIAALIILILYIVFGSKSVFGPAAEIEKGTKSANILNALNFENPSQ